MLYSYSSVLKSSRSILEWCYQWFHASLWCENYELYAFVLFYIIREKHVIDDNVLEKLLYFWNNNTHTCIHKIRPVSHTHIWQAKHCLGFNTKQNMNAILFTQGATTKEIFHEIQTHKTVLLQFSSFILRKRQNIYYYYYYNILLLLLYRNM